MNSNENKANKNEIHEAIKAKIKPKFKHPDTQIELNQESLEALFKEDLDK